MTLPNDIERFFAELFHEYLQKGEVEIFKAFEAIPVHHEEEVDNPHNNCLFGRWIAILEKMPVTETLARDCAKEIIQTWKNNKKLTESDIVRVVSKFIAIAIPMGLYCVSRGNMDKQAALMYAEKYKSGTGGEYDA